MSNSTLASLASHTTTQAATAASTAHKQTKNFTGQYWFERFVTDKDETTKLHIIKQATESVDVASLKASLDDMVEMAKKQDIAAGIPETEVTAKGATYKAAANTRSIIQKVYGALRFASDELASLGYNDSMGYHATSMLAKKALENKVVKWDGSQGKTKEQREKDSRFRMETKALREIQQATPRNDDESLIQYQQRTTRMVAERIEQMKLEQALENVDAQVQAILEMGHDAAKTIAEAVLASLNALIPA